MALSIVDGALLVALLELRDNGPSSNFVGVCNNLHHNIPEQLQYDSNGDAIAYEFVTNNQASWEHFSGSIAYPVPENRRFNKWEGPNAAMRYSLIDHLIKVLTDRDKYCANV